MLNISRYVQTGVCGKLGVIAVSHVDKEGELESGYASVIRVKRLSVLDLIVITLTVKQGWVFVAKYQVLGCYYFMFRIAHTTLSGLSIRHVLCPVEGATQYERDPVYLRERIVPIYLDQLYKM